MGKEPSEIADILEKDRVTVLLNSLGCFMLLRLPEVL